MGSMAARRTSKRWAVLLVSVLAGSAVLSACRDDDNVVFYKDHVYKGRHEPALNSTTVSELTARTQQGGRL